MTLSSCHSPLSRFVIGSSQDIYWLRHKELFETGRPQSCELLALREGTSPFWVKMRTTMARGSDGEPVCRAAAIDITRHKRLEAALLQSERKHRIVAENTYDWEFWVDAEGRFLYSSPSSLRVTGHEAGEFMTDAALLRRIIHADDQAAYATHETETNSSTAPGMCEFRIILPDGTQRWIGHVCGPVLDEDGAVMGRRGSNRDITEHKWAESVIRRRNAVLDGINRILQSVIGTDTEEELGQLCLAIAEEITGSQFGFIDEINAQGKLDTIAISNPGWDACRMGVTHPPKNLAIHGIHGRVIQDGRGFFTNDPAGHPDRIGVPPGHPALTAFLGVPLFREGRVIGMVAVGNRKGGYSPAELEDLQTLASAIVEAFARKRADQRQAELLEELTSVNQELKDFAYVVSHDLKEPLRAVKALADWLVSDYAETLDPEGKENLHLLGSRVQRMENLIDGILQYSRVGRAKSDAVPVDLGRIVPEIVGNLDVPEHILIQVENDLPTVEIDPTRITQVFQNLLSNAVKYMDKPQGTIHVACVEEVGFWKFSVSDNGPGIEENHFERIFKLFQTLAPRNGNGSTGVGLTIAKKIVEMCGGRIWVESQVGEGSTFFFTLPQTTADIPRADRAVLNA